jgi:hypothetical protein
MKLIDFDEILVKHLIKFDFDKSKSIEFIKPHNLFKIEDSIHYNSLINDEFEDYKKLITTTNQKEHSVESFLKLKESFNEESLCKNENKINITWDEEISKYIVEDGCHRLALLMYNNKERKLPIEWFKIIK